MSILDVIDQGCLLVVLAAQLYVLDDVIHRQRLPDNGRPDRVPQVRKVNVEVVVGGLVVEVDTDQGTWDTELFLDRVEAFLLGWEVGVK